MKGDPRPPSRRPIKRSAGSGSAGAVAPGTQTTRDDPRPEVGELRRAFVQSVQAGLPAARSELTSRFAERRARADELATMGQFAIALSERRDRTLAEIKSVLAAFA